MYFYGFACGIIFFSMPDAIGRKATMRNLLPPLIIACSLSVYGNSIVLKGIGFFFQGFFHLKTMLSYTHIFELVSKDHKSFCATFIGTFDSLSFAFHGLYYTFVEKDGVAYLEYTYWIGTVATILYLLIIPESPRWLFQNQRNEEGIKVMNQIAAFNFSERRIPAKAKFDLLEEAVV